MCRNVLGFFGVFLGFFVSFYREGEDDMEWEKAIRKEGNTFEIPETWLFPYYYEVLTALFRIENALRVFVFSILKNELKEKWSSLSIKSDESVDGTIESIAKKRISQAKDFGYLGYFVNCPIMYLTTGELIHLITSERYWKYFCNYFLGSKAIMENKLNEIINVRNAIAHFRPIKQGDVELIKQNAAHALGAIESCILQLTNCQNVVPTNTAESWYKELRILGADGISLSLFFSENEEWVRIELKYHCPIVSKKVFEKRYVFYRLLTIISPAILAKYSPLRSQIIYLSEEIPYNRMQEGFDSDFFKNINIILSKKTIGEHHEEICSQIKELMADVVKETDLIKQDNLAKGEIVKAVDASASYEKVTEGGHWNFYTNTMVCDVEENSPSEFWGSGNFASMNFISDTHKYPWMPVDIAAKKSFW